MDFVEQQQQRKKKCDENKWRSEKEYENAVWVLLSHSCIVYLIPLKIVLTHNVFIVFSLSSTKCEVNMSIPANASRNLCAESLNFYKSHLMCIILSLSSIICMNGIVRVCESTSHFLRLFIFYNFFLCYSNYCIHSHEAQILTKEFVKNAVQKHLIDNFGKHFFNSGDQTSVHCTVIVCVFFMAKFPFISKSSAKNLFKSI